MRRRGYEDGPRGEGLDSRRKVPHIMAPHSQVDTEIYSRPFSQVRGSFYECDTGCFRCLQVVDPNYHCSAEFWHRCRMEPHVPLLE